MVPVTLLTVDAMTSIIVITCNQLAAIRRCLESIRECTRDPYELIVIDNHSADGTRKYLKSCQAAKIVFNSENVGYARGVNQGVRLSEGRYLVLLNNDTMVTPGWLHTMIACLESDPRIALVGPMTSDHDCREQFFRPACLSYVDSSYFKKKLTDVFQSPDGRLLRIGRYRNEKELTQFAREFFPVREQNHPSSREVIVVTGFCMLMRRSLFDELGFLDERFENGAEDCDFTLRALLAGKKIVVAEQAFVHHDAGRTFSGLGIDRWSHYAKNWRQLERKWVKHPRAREIIKQMAGS